MIKETYKGCQIGLMDGMVLLEIYDDSRQAYVLKGYVRDNVEELSKFAKEVIDDYKEHPEKFIKE